MPRDLRSRLSSQISLAPAARTAAANGSIIDRQGFDGVYALLAFGTWTDGTHTPALLESADGVTFTAPAAADLLGSFAAVGSAAGNNTIQQVSYIGSARYLRLVVTVTGATAGATSTGLIVRGYSSQQPVM